MNSALDWFFDQEPEGIILEDDCLPDQSFFRYCSELLERYRSDPNVAFVSGDGALGASGISKHSYVFSRYPLVWGWASWRRAWLQNDDSMVTWAALRDTDWLERIGDGDKDFGRYWTKILDASYSRHIDSWAYPWMFSCWVSGGVAALPVRNMVLNIGFGSEATHTKEVDPGRSATLEAIEFPLVHPPAVRRCPEADRWLDTHVFGTNPTRRARFLGATRRILYRLPAGSRLAAFVRPVRRFIKGMAQ